MCVFRQREGRKVRCEMVSNNGEQGVLNMGLSYRNASSIQVCRNKEAW